jgi:hypothetical protein
MFSRIHNKLGSAGLVVAIMALVAALAGTAFAAAGLTSQEKKEVKKIAKKFAGQPGAAGAIGPVGPQGPAGPAGKDGTNGTNGKNVVTGTEAAATGNCEGRGGVWVEVEGSGVKKYVCNGAGGAAGSATQTGLWAFENESSFYMMPMSFPRQVENEPNFNLIQWGTTPTAIQGELSACPGTPSNPEAEPGEFCMYAEELTDATFSTANAYTVDRNSGFVVEFSIGSGKLGYGFGSWAVNDTPPTP